MLDAIWFGLLFCGVLCALCTGRGEELSAGLLEGAGKGVELTLSLLGSLCAWTGFLHIAQDSGLSGKLAKALSPVIVRLFPDYREDREVQGKIAMNLAANFLGLGNAATPMGINAVCALDDGAERANTDMIMALVLSSSSLQLLPGTVIAMRVARGAAAPVSFLPANIIATVASTVIGISLVKILSAAGRRRASEKASKKNNNRGIARKKSGEKSFMRGSAGKKA